MYARGQRKGENGKTTILKVVLIWIERRGTWGEKKKKGKAFKHASER